MSIFALTGCTPDPETQFREANVESGITVEEGRAACKLISRTPTPMETYMFAAAHALSAEEFGVLTADAVYYLCPEHAAIADELFDSQR